MIRLDLYGSDWSDQAPRPIWLGGAIVRRRGIEVDRADVRDTAKLIDSLAPPTLLRLVSPLLWAHVLARRSRTPHAEVKIARRSDAPSVIDRVSSIFSSRPRTSRI